jgi:superfamily II helicase
MSNFVVISRKEFEDFLNKFNVIDEPSSKEIIYEIPTDNSKVNIRIYSSIDISGGSRELGEDAIRCILIDNKSNKPIDKAKRTHRMSNWKERLQEKIDDLKKETKDLKSCQTCGSIMVLRDGPKSQFYGCLSYPQCKTSMDLFGITRIKSEPTTQAVVSTVRCPDCDAIMTKRSGRRGEFYGCSNFFQTSCKGTRQVNEVEIYGKGVEEEHFEEELLPSKPAIFEPQKEEVKPAIDLVPTSKFTYLTFKFENFNPVQSEVFQYYDKDVNCVVAAATSAGKTTVAEMFMAHSISQGKKAIFLSPLKAVSQEKYDDWTDPSHDWSKLNISIVTGDYALTDARVEELNKANIVIMTLEMLDSRTRRIAIEKNSWLFETGVVVVDECFSRGAQVRVEENVELDIQKIYNNEKIKFVMSYNEKEKTLEKKKIIRRIKKPFDEKFLSIKYEVEGKFNSFICTPNHKIWTNRGYIKAEDIKVNDVLKIFPLSKEYKCDICDNVFRNKLLFLKHYGKEHVRQEKYICVECKKEFYRRGDLTHHKHFVHEKTELICVNCGRLLANKKSFDSHIKKCHSEANFKCNYCHATFKEKSQLKSHFYNEHKMFESVVQKRHVLEFNRDKETQEIWLEGKNMMVTKLEKMIIGLNDKNILYTGNHLLWLTLGKLENGKYWRKNPDFKVLGQRKVIEVGNLYWHSKEEIEQVIKGYESINYKCLYLTHIDLEDHWEESKEKIKTFIHNHDGVVKRVRYWGSRATKNCFVYNLEVEDNHNYIVNNVLVSNCHLLTVKGRGDKVESAVMRFTKQNTTCRIVFLSATMPNVDELAKWLTSLNNKKSELINSSYRPIQLDVHYEPYDDYGKYQTVEGNKIQRTVEITLKKYALGEQVLIFVHSKKTGRELMNVFLNQGIKKSEIEYHYSDLSVKDRNEISRKTKTKEIKILIATSGLAWGINI